uniref:Uncharacterized protein n=1 Tax=Timema tahoe TaxID=61484 RepID=A0A7R9IDQ1_9NEOP|nr:unnamed protein product [Timema tahoe]
MGLFQVVVVGVLVAGGFTGAAETGDYIRGLRASTSNRPEKYPRNQPGIETGTPRLVAGLTDQYTMELPEPIRYEYRYAVDDPQSGVVNDRWEHRLGEYVKGAYSLLEPDGKVRTVDYEVDGAKGFHAVIRTNNPAIRLLSTSQLLQSTMRHGNPPVNTLTNFPLKEKPDVPQRTPRVFLYDLPANYHSLSPYYYLSRVKGKKTEYPSRDNSQVNVPEMEMEANGVIRPSQKLLTPLPSPDRNQRLSWTTRDIFLAPQKSSSPHHVSSADSSLNIYQQQRKVAPIYTSEFSSRTLKNKYPG